jgi:GNAT superfamily N-acetyltransferase
MNLFIRTIRSEDYPSAFAFQNEYLDRESYTDFIQRVEQNPDLYLAAFDEDELIGVCFGHPSKKIVAAITLQGIAVSLDVKKDYARKGIGSGLLKAFEAAVKVKGYPRIDLGAADDPKVESFYLKNEYEPYELVVYDWNYHERERVPVNGYEAGLILKKELRAKYNPKEVIFIFHKNI